MDQPRERANLHHIRGSRNADGLSDALVTVHAPTAIASEAYRMLRTNLFYAVIDDPPRVIVLTSSSPQEGKSVTCANLGVVLAQAGKKVALLDCDLRNPVQHKLFGIKSSPGLMDVVLDAQSLPRVWHEPLSGLKVVPAGHRPPNPSEIVSSRRFTEFLIKLRQDFDYVLLDTPPVRMVSDSAVLAKQGDGVLLVLDEEDASKRSLRQAMNVLEGVGANIIGTVVNKAKISKRDNDIYQSYGAD